MHAAKKGLLDPETTAMGAAIVAGVFLAVVIISLALFLFRSQPPPGKLKESGTFEHEDPGTEDAKLERKRDFSRIAATKRDLWILSPSEREAQVALQVPTSSDVVADEAVEQAAKTLKEWLQKALQQTAAEVDLEPLTERVLAAVSVTPGFEFIVRHKVPPMIMQGKYIIIVSTTGQVRVAWYAFITDSPKPNAVAGPFVVKLVTEDLASADRAKRTYTQFRYTARSTSSEDMSRIISRHLKHMLAGIDREAWDDYLAA